jgi:hypothetical protein
METAMFRGRGGGGRAIAAVAAAATVVATTGMKIGGPAGEFPANIFEPGKKT